MTSQTSELVEALALTLDDWQALVRIIDTNIRENDGPDRVRWEGTWHEGPLATAYLKTLRAIREMAARNTTLLERLSSSEVTEEWLPIESAPKNGTDFLAGRPRDGGTLRLPAQIIVRWSPIAKDWVAVNTAYGSVRDRFPFWRPLPEPPRSAATSERKG